MAASSHSSDTAVLLYLCKLGSKATSQATYLVWLHTLPSLTVFLPLFVGGSKFVKYLHNGDCLPAAMLAATWMLFCTTRPTVTVSVSKETQLLRGALAGSRHCRGGGGCWLCMGWLRRVETHSLHSCWRRYLRCKWNLNNLHPCGTCVTHDAWCVYDVRCAFSGGVYGFGLKKEILKLNLAYGDFWAILK